MKEVSELVEWAARELSFIDKSNQWDSLPDEKLVGELSKPAYRCRAKQILSHPDLALKCPRCKGVGKVDGYAPTDPYTVYNQYLQCPMCKGTRLIYLAEALKGEE